MSVYHGLDAYVLIMSRGVEEVVAWMEEVEGEKDLEDDRWNGRSKTICNIQKTHFNSSTL